MSPWNWLDVILVLVVLISVVTAATKGFIRELIALAAIVTGLVVASLGYSRGASWIDDLTRSHEVALGAAFLTLFFGVLLLGALVSVLAKKLIKTAGIQSADRLLGGAFGLVRGLLIDCVLLMALVAFSMKPEALQQSLLAPYVTTGARAMALVMPGSLKAQFRGGFEKFHQALISRDRKTSAH